MIAGMTNVSGVVGLAVTPSNAITALWCVAKIAFSGRVTTSRKESNQNRIKCHKYRAGTVVVEVKEKAKAKKKEPPNLRHLRCARRVGGAQIANAKIHVETTTATTRP
jgi:hypothetical protein